MITYTATYSPDDNKLRLYASQRLDAETYARVRAAGFIWAPKQELFVAPAWGPERAALCEELAGEIGDEDQSLAERAEARAERFEDYSDKRANDADAAAAAVHRLADGIPLGQPILIGHHSEKRARKDAERIDAGMRRAVNAWKTSEYWTRRAAAAIAHADYKERPDVRARRIAKLEAELRKVDKNIKNTEIFLNRWGRVLGGELKNKAGEVVDARTAALSLSNFDHVSQCFPLAEYPRQAPASQYEGAMSLWSALGGSDGEAHAIITPAQAVDIATRAHERYLTVARQWSEHYNFRLSYERAMLAASGGTVAQRTGPEKGGAVQCLWAPRGGWAYIQKVNKVTVTILHSWGNDGGRTFRQNVALDKLAAVMTRAEVEAATAEGRIVPVGNLGFYLAAPKGPKAPEKVDAPTPAPVDDVCPDGPACPDDGCQAERFARGLEVREPETPAADFEAMAATLKAGGAKVITAPQLFPTPRALADRMAEAAGFEDGHRVLEPSAGTGALLRAALRACDGALDITAVEINTDLAMQLSAEGLASTVEAGRDFLTCNGDLGKFDRVIMNPPFGGAADIRHILHARQFLKPGGRIVALCANGPRQCDSLRELAERSGGYFEPLPAGQFDGQGTGVNVALVVIEHENA